jgi:hypothetical protein
MQYVFHLSNRVTVFAYRPPSCAICERVTARSDANRNKVNDLALPR